MLHLAAVAAYYLKYMYDEPASLQIDRIIRTHGGWKGTALARLRTVITSADDRVFEEVKWKTASRPEGLPVWSYKGILCFAEVWKDNIKLLFSHGAEFDDPKKLFNARLQSSALRAIELHEGDEVDEADLVALVLEAITYNGKK